MIYIIYSIIGFWGCQQLIKKHIQKYLFMFKKYKFLGYYY